MSCKMYVIQEILQIKHKSVNILISDVNINNI